MQIVFGACLFALFLVLSMLSVFCFSRNWLRSGYDLRLGKVEDGLLKDANVRYVVVNKQTEGIPATIPASLSKVFENSEYAVFKVDPQRLSETVPKTL
jgi:hypothetical protein